MLLEEKIQRELVRLLNRWAEGYETALLEDFANWANENLISSYKIVEKPENYGKRNMWVLEKHDKN